MGVRKLIDSEFKSMKQKDVNIGGKIYAVYTIDFDNSVENDNHSVQSNSVNTINAFAGGGSCG